MDKNIIALGIIISYPILAFDYKIAIHFFVRKVFFVAANSIRKQCGVVNRPKKLYLLNILASVLGCAHIEIPEFISTRKNVLLVIVVVEHIFADIIGF